MFFFVALNLKAKINCLKYTIHDKKNVCTHFCLTAENAQEKNLPTLGKVHGGLIFKCCY